ncbi:MAG: phenylalanine--tRNA ligase subunit beta [Desulfobacterales bacterium]|nr:MAG: phenylalanine--tRNA ligase subunit beta [Desulfobacterales bacterium]
MKVPLSWLKEYVPVHMPAAELSESLTMLGLEVDSADDRHAWMNTVLVGRIENVVPHPDADRLRLCDVAAGERRVRVVCGAPNAAPGLLAPLALPGTEFPDGRILEESVLRGQTSEGMLCSAIELGMDEDGNGLLALAPDLVPGTPLPAALNLFDPVIEIELTPNRPDCLGMIGIAREVAALQGETLRLPAVSLPKEKGAIGDRTSVRIDAPGHCRRFTARMLMGVTVGPSPAWMKDRLRSIGIRPVNNIVDVTNYVMMETGQPLHAFDYDRLAEGRITVRLAEEGEKFTTLDGRERILDGQMLMICDGKQPVSVGGVMGGLNSEIKNDTTNVLIEVACFEPASIRKTARKLGLGTDASHRFERGVDPANTLNVLDRAAGLMAELSGGELVGGHIDVHPRPARPCIISVTASQINNRLGLQLDRDAMSGLLISVDFTVVPEGEEGMRVTVPSFRVDVSRWQDLSEEVARLHGMDRIRATFPPMRGGGRPPGPMISLRRMIQDLLTGFGCTEVISYSFIERESTDRLRFREDDERRRQLTILNPISGDMAVMRTDLLSGLLHTVARNIARGTRTLTLYETGKIFLSNGQDALPDEKERLAAVWTGSRRAAHWENADIPCDFYDIKGLLEALFAGLRVRDTAFSALADDRCSWSRPGRTALVTVSGQEVGMVGEVRNEVLADHGVKQAVFAFSLNLDRLLPLLPGEIAASPVPRFPAVNRDITIIVDRDTPAADMLDHIRAAKTDLVKDVFVFDVYEGENVPEGRKNLSFRVVYRSDTATLEDGQITALHTRISHDLLSAFDGAFPG